MISEAGRFFAQIVPVEAPTTKETGMRSLWKSLFGIIAFAMIPAFTCASDPADRADAAAARADARAAAAEARADARAAATEARADAHSAAAEARAEAQAAARDARADTRDAVRDSRPTPQEHRSKIEREVNRIERKPAIKDRHRDNSPAHRRGAIDYRSKDVSRTKRHKEAKDLSGRLGKDYTTVVEEVYYHPVTKDPDDQRNTAYKDGKKGRTRWTHQSNGRGVKASATHTHVQPDKSKKKNQKKD